MLGLNIRRAELAGFIPRKKDYAPGFLRVAFEHMGLPLALLGASLTGWLSTRTIPSIMHFHRPSAQAVLTSVTQILSTSVCASTLSCLSFRRRPHSGVTPEAIPAALLPLCLC